MTDLISRPPGPRAPRRPPAAPVPPTRPLSATGVLVALQAAGLGVLAVLVVVLVGWATAADTEATATTAVTGALHVWLLGHGVTLTLDPGAFSLTPLGLTALPVVLLHTATVRAGRAVEVRAGRAVAALTATVTATYAVTAVAVALVAGSDPVRALPVDAFLAPAVLAAAAAGSGAVRASGRAGVLWHRLPGLLRATLPAAAVAVGSLLAGAAMLAGLALGVRHGEAQALVRALDPGAAGAVLLGLGCLAYVPVAVVWAAAYAVGPGFAVGSGTSVTIAGSDLAAVPAVPVLAALPEGDGPLRWLVVLVPLAAGVAAGLRLGPGRGWRDDLEACGLTGLLSGTAVAALSLLSAGAAGPGRMAEVGPDWWAVGPVAGLEVAVVAALVLVTRRLWRAP